MNERITKPETHAPTPLPHLPGQPYTQPQDAHARPMTGGKTEHFAGRGEPLTRTEKLLVTMFVTMFATLVAAGALGFTTLSGQLVDMQRQTSTQLLDMQTQIGTFQKEIGGQLLDMQRQIGELSERMVRIETALQVHHGPLPGP